MDPRPQIREFITGNFLIVDAGIADDASLLELGVVDSTGVLEIIAFLEKTFEVAVEDDEIVPENLDSVDRIVEFAKRKLEARGPAPALLPLREARPSAGPESEEQAERGMRVR